MISFSSILKAIGFTSDIVPRRAVWRGATAITRGHVAAIPISMQNATYNSFDKENDNYYARNALELTADANAHVNHMLVVAQSTILPGSLGLFALAGEIDVYLGVGQDAGADLTPAGGHVISSFKNVAAAAPATYVDRTVWTRPVNGAGSHDTLNVLAAIFGVIVDPAGAPASASPGLRRCAWDGRGILHMRGGGA